MMKRYDLLTPEGTGDLLLEDCAVRRGLEERLAALFTSLGYSEVATPGLEFYDTFHFNSRYFPQESMYKLTDGKGRLLVARPDSTLPIARVAATRLRNLPLPMRLFYCQDVYRSKTALRGRSDEIRQMGIELIGSADDGADLEVVTAAIEVLSVCDKDNFRLEIGDIGFFKELVRKLDIDPAPAENIRVLIESKNYPALNDLLDEIGDNKAANALKHLPRLFGGYDVFQKARRLFEDEETVRVLGRLENIYKKLSELGHSDKITVDLGIANKMDYYTGIVIKGYIKGYGDSVLSGGRYDGLLSEFGFDQPATGFALNIDAAAKLIKRSDTRESPSQSRPLRIALTKGRLEKKATELLESIGYDCEAVRNKGRKLILSIYDGAGKAVEIVLAKPADVITYVENGVCDMGVVGKDTVMETGGKYFELADLGLGKCGFALAGKKGGDFYGGYNVKTVATKYPNVARDFFDKKGMDVDIVRIEGSVELAPLLGLADAIVDIVETGGTLRENGLEVIERIADISARLIVNRVSLKLRQSEIEALVAKLTKGERDLCSE